MRQFKIKNFDKGLVTNIEDFSIPESAASDSLNWLTLGDKIELSGGYTIIGTEQTGTGKVTGLAIGEKVDGTRVPIRARGKKLEYYTASDWVEIGTDKLGTAADGEDVAMSPYTSLAGYQMWVSSPNSSLYKMMLANPADIKDVYSSAKNYKGYLKIQNSRNHMWNRVLNRNYIYGSYKDLQNSTVYTSVTAEAVGSSGSTTYSGTLADVTGFRTCFGVTITDGTTTLTDDKNGGFTGAGTGTINYATGAYSVTFNSATVGSVTASYSWEDSTVHGLADFTFSATRTASQGFFLPQPTGGDLKNMLFYRTNAYCLHQNNAYLFYISDDDVTTVTNTVFRVNIGMDNWRSAVETGDGIWYIDSTNPSKPVFKLLTLEQYSDQVAPREMSFNVDLSGFDFSDGAAYEWDNYIIFFGKVAGATNNNRMFAYHKIWKTFDVLDYYGRMAIDYDGALWVGDSATNNVYRAFSGYSANGSVVRNYWEGKLSQLEIDELKKFKRLTLTGQIGIAQNIKVYLAYDNAPFVEVGEIDGAGDYVDRSAAATIGSTMVGSTEIGGGTDGSDRFNYVRELRIRSSRFDKVKIRFEATGVGYASVSETNFYDIQTRGQKNLLRYRST